MPVELDLTGCCCVCYLPLIAGRSEEQGCGKVCPWDATHTPRVQLAGPRDAEELLEALTVDLRLERPCSLGGAELAAGAELLVAEKQAFWIDRGRFEAFDPPDTKVALAAAIAECGGCLQLTFRNPRPAGALLLALEPPAPGLGSPADEWQDDGAVLLPARDSPRRRLDPSDGRACTWREVRQRYAAEMSPGETYAYWCSQCRPEDNGGRCGEPSCRSPARGCGGGSSGSSARPAGSAAEAAEAPDAPAAASGREPAKGRGRGRGRGRGQAEAAARAAALEEAPNGKPALLAEAPSGASLPRADGGGPAVRGDRLVEAVAGGGPASGGGAPNGKLAGVGETTNGHGRFDAAAWLREVETAGFLLPYAEAISASFGSLAELRRAHEEGKEQLYKMAGITKLGHKRLIDKVLNGE